MSDGHAFSDIASYLNELFYERDDVIDAVLVTLLAGENAFILGMPGTAKTELLQALCSCIEGAQFFDILCDPMLGKEDFFGPIDYPLFKETGKWRRDTTGSLYEAHIALGDETFKAGASVLNMLLRAMNEHQGKIGMEQEKIPLIAFFGASNELPDVGLAAIWDRFLMRLSVDYLHQESNVKKLLTRAPAEKKTFLTLATLQEIIADTVPSITVPEAIIDSVIELRAELLDQGVIVSDRRWRKTIRLLQASAFLDQRLSVTDDDIVVLRHALWEREEQVGVVNQLVIARSSPYVTLCLEVKDDIHDWMRHIEDNSTLSTEDRTKANVSLLHPMNEAVQLVEQSRQKAQADGRRADRLIATLDALLEVRFQTLLSMMSASGEDNVRKSAATQHQKQIDAVTLMHSS